MTITVDRDQQIEWLNVEEPTAEELARIDELERGDYEVFSERLKLMLDEGRQVFERTGISQFIDAGDLSVNLYSANGDLVEANAGAYLFGVAGVPQIKYMIEKFEEDETVGIEPGDVFYANDALFGGVHNPDQIAFMPIFHEEERIGWTSAAVHTTETGAIEPGGMPVDATTRHDEGMKLSPIKIGEDYELKSDMVDMIVNYISRAPSMQEIDMRARVTTADRVRRRFKEDVIEEKGADFAKGLLRQNIIEAREGAKERISQWNDGEFRTVQFADFTGQEESLHRVKLTLEKEDDRLHFDYTGTSPEHGGSFNSHPVAAICHTANYIFQVPFHDLPTSNGTYDMIDFTIPEGSVFYPDKEACTSMSVIVGRLMMSTAANCLSRMYYDSEEEKFRDQVTASHATTGSGYAFGAMSQWGRPVSDMLTHPLNTEGMGARSHSDGEDAAYFSWCPFGRASNLENVENEYPFTVHTYKHLPDSCGHGKYRGGVGAQIGYMMYHNPVNFMSVSTNTKVHNSAGIYGGYSPNTIPGIVIKDGDLREKLSKEKDIPYDVFESLDEWIEDPDTDVEISHHCRRTQQYDVGDMFIGYSSGGAGYGDAVERDPKAVMKDLENNRITHWSAKNIYKVEYDEEALIVDEEGTEEKREKFLEERRDESIPFDEFIEGWETRKPKDEILTAYGSWPDAEKDRRIIRQ